jgi:hypothetical protein
MTLPRDRIAYSSPFTRPPLKLPGNGRMIVWTVVNVEEWEITGAAMPQLTKRSRVVSSSRASASQLVAMQSRRLW